MRDNIPSLGEIQGKILVVKEDKTLGHVSAELSEGLKIIIKKDNENFMLSPDTLALYPFTRLLSDLPLEAVPVADSGMTVLDGLALMEDKGARHLLVFAGNEPTGYVSREMLLESVLAIARKSERLAVLLTESLKAGNTIAWRILLEQGEDPRLDSLDLKALEVYGPVSDLLGYKVENLVEKGREWARELIHPDDLEAVKEGLYDLLQGRRQTATRLRLRHGRNDKFVWVQSIMTMERDGSGKPLALRGVVTGVDQIVRAGEKQRKMLHDMNELLEKKVRQRTFELEVLKDMALKLGTALHYDDLFEKVAMGLRPVIDHDLLITIVYTDEVKEIIYYPRRDMPDELIERMSKKLIHSFVRMGGGETRLDQTRKFCGHKDFKPNGSRFVQDLESIVLVPLFVNSGKELVGMMLVAAERPDAFDMDQIRLMNTVVQQASVSIEKLRALVAAQRHRLESMVEHLPEGVALLNQDGNVLVYNNRAKDFFMKALGWRPGRTLGTSFGIKLFKSLEQMEKRSIEIPLNENGKDDRRVFECKSSRVVNRAGQEDPEESLWVLTMRDVTREREIEQQAMAQQRLVAIGELSGGVAHDFNNLLTVIINLTELIIQDLKPGDPIKEDLEQVMDAGKRAVSLTRQLLAFSRRQVLRPKSINLNEVVRNLDKMLKRLIGEDIKLVSNLADDLPAIEADPAQLEQVIINLSVNARDAMPEGGTLTITTREVELDRDFVSRHLGARPGKFVMLSISDTGIGMNKETRAKVFEPFFTTKPQGKGTGLGLSMVYGIVKQSNGNIWLDSFPGKGTTFRVYLPVFEGVGDGEGYREGAGDTGEIMRPGAGETILVVEDEGPVRRLATRVLKRAGYNVLEARDGLEAITLAGQYKGDIDMVLTDVVMPGPNGRMTVEELKARRPGIKVLYMSGYTDNAIVHHGVLEKGAELMAKPFNIDELVRRVEKLLSKKKGD
ncbi:MAG: response regulator [Deltaproteobacteria bacterium]|nr:response regulator [Deltaproteobacteria bacterium]